MNTSKISVTGGSFMILSALLFDGIQALVTLIPVIGLLIAPIISIVAALFFGIGFSHLDASMMESKRVLRFLGTILVELVPGIDVAPGWTGSIAYTVIKEWRSSEGI